MERVTAIRVTFHSLNNFQKESKSDDILGAYPIHYPREMSIEWLGRIQTMDIDVSTISYSKLKKDIVHMFNIDRTFLRPLYMKVILKCWDAKSGKSQEITKHNFRDLSFDHIYVIIIDVP